MGHCISTGNASSGRRGSTKGNTSAQGWTGECASNGLKFGRAVCKMRQSEEKEPESSKLPLEQKGKKSVFRNKMIVWKWKKF